MGVAKAGNLKLDFMAKSIGIHLFEFQDMFRCYRDNENLKKHFGHMDTLNLLLNMVSGSNSSKQLCFSLEVSAAIPYQSSL